jgi:hypothetical protein
VIEPIPSPGTCVWAGTAEASTVDVLVRVGRDDEDFASFGLKDECVLGE